MKVTPFAVNGVSLSKPYISVVYGNMSINRLTVFVLASFPVLHRSYHCLQYE